VRNAYKILIGKADWKRDGMGDVSSNWEDWIQVAQDSSEWWILVPSGYIRGEEFHGQLSKY
jgi:hypothetical protein